MDFKGCEAERKFWRTPELIERLLLLLDEKSTLVLAQSHVRTLNVLEGGWVWNKFIARICPCDEDDKECVKEPEKKLDVIKNLVEILKLVEDPKVLLTDLLELICERCSCRHSEPHVLPLVCQTYIDLKDREDVELFKVFMQFQPGVDLGLKLKVTGPIGGDGWAMLAMALEIPPHVNIRIVTSKAV